MQGLFSMGQMGWTPAAQLATQNMQGAAGTYAAMDKAKNETQNAMGQQSKTGTSTKTETTEEEDPNAGLSTALGVVGSVAGMFTGGLGTALAGAATAAAAGASKGHV